MNGQLTGGSCEPKRQPEIIEAMEMLNKQITVLEQAGSNLFERIRVVRREEPTTESEASSKAESY